MSVGMIAEPPVVTDIPRKRWTRSEYEALDTVEALQGLHLELVEGELIDKMGKKKEEELPPELQGKTAEEIAASLKESADLKAKLTKLEDERSQEKVVVTGLQSEFNTMKERLAAAELKANPPKPRVEEEVANFVEDPDKAFSQRVAPVATIAIQGAAQTARIIAQQQLDNMDLGSNGKTMDGRLFRVWSNEIDQQATKYQAIQLGDPKAWLGIFYYIKGLKADELRDPEERKKKYNFLEPANTSITPPPDGKKKDGVEALTDQEKHVADRMKVSYENYAKRKKSMQFVNT